MRRAPVIELSAEEHTELQRTARSSRSSVREVFRARIVLLAAEGQENRAIAGAVGYPSRHRVEMEEALRRTTHGGPH